MKVLLAILWMLPPEAAHSIALNSLKLLHKLKLINLFFPFKFSNSPFYFKGLEFKNRLGIAAGLDKNGDFIDSLGALGFGFIEVGTVTPKPQSGNSKPRVFRFPDQEAIVNRLGFNNKGVDYLVERVKSRKYLGVLGINIGANKDSKGQKRIDDYIECFKKHGIKVALDDFGTGLNNFDAVFNYDIDKVKTDKKFLNLNVEVREAFFSSICSITEKLGLDLVVEGIETTSELIALQELGVTTVQGFIKRQLT